MAQRITLSRIPVYCSSPTASPPEHRALLIGINYAPSVGDKGQVYRELKGPVNDAKEMKKALIELFDYMEEDVRLMTDEETNRDSALWPSKENIMRELRELVRDACPGDAFVFFYAGHCGQQKATTDPNEIDGLDEYIITCDHEIILDDTLRECLVDPLPSGTRLTAILDACHSGTLLDLDHYSCHCFLPQRAKSLQEKEAKHYEGPLPRHHSNDDQHWLVRGAARLCNMTFSFIALISLAIVRFKIRLVRRRKQVQLEVEVEVLDRADLASLTSVIPRPPCASSSCVNAFSNGPLVISVSSCSDQQSTWEDSQNKGKSMTTKLVKILRENPSINVGDLNQQLQRSLARTAFKRLWEAKSTFKAYSAKLSPHQREKYEVMYTEQGFFNLREQTAQFGSLHRLRQEEEFIVKRADTLELLLHPAS
ncbi:caspase domain-containing protein [Lactarius pseudohatsudake]|nr:caspase domain-containing protein [Lactarius pseudohatsudake]